MTEISDSAIREVLADAENGVPQEKFQITRKAVVMLCRRALEAGEAIKARVFYQSNFEHQASVANALREDRDRLEGEIQQARDQEQIHADNCARLEAENTKLREQLADLLLEPECSEGCRL